MAAVRACRGESILNVAIYTIDPLSDPRWQEIEIEHPNASIFHTHGWLKALQATYSYHPLAFTTCAPGSRLTSAFPFCLIKSWLTGHRMVSLPFSDHCSPLIGEAEVDEYLESFRNNKLAGTSPQYIEIRPRHAEMFHPSGFYIAKTFAYHVLSLRPSVSELVRRFHKDCVQRKLRRAEREHLQYEEGTSKSLLKKFYYLMVRTRRRHGLPPQPLSWFQNLISFLGNSVLLRVVSKGQDPVAGALTLRHKDVMTYKYGCSDRNAKACGGTQLVLWNAIRDAKNTGLTAFDMGRSDDGDHGLITFKERWGAQRSRLTYWRLSTDHTNRAQWAAPVAKQMASHMPAPLLISLGKLLYRHAG